MAIIDHFETLSASQTGSILGGFDIAPNDGVDLNVLTRALMVTGEGDVVAVLMDGTTLTLPGLVVGVIYPMRVRRVLATGTTATGIKGLY